MQYIAVGRDFLGGMTPVGEEEVGERETQRAEMIEFIIYIYITVKQ